MNNQYEMYSKKWRKMRDVFKGDEHMKERAFSQSVHFTTGNCNSSRTGFKDNSNFGQYIRPTNTMRKRPDGQVLFNDYIYRSKWYDFPLEIRNQSLGLIQTEPPVIELPSQMESMRLNCTSKRESITKVMSITNTQQLEVSRVGLLLEPAADVNKPFNTAIYNAESIVDWNVIVDSNSNEILDWLVLLTDEIYDNKPVYLVLRLEVNENFMPVLYYQYKTTSEDLKYEKSMSEDEDVVPGSYIEPDANERIGTEIPFIVANVTRLGMDIERPFLEPVADSSISLFRSSALYEDALYWGGESTLFTNGFGDGDSSKIYVGNGAVNAAKTSDSVSAEYVTMGTEGIEPRKTNMTDKFNYCVSIGVDLINQGQESGVALEIRSNVKTASLKTLALTGAMALERLLKIGARWLGIDDNAVSIQANTTFADVRYTASDFVSFASLVPIGAMRRQDYYEMQKKQNLTNAESYEDWVDGLEVSQVKSNDNEVVVE